MTNNLFKALLGIVLRSLPGLEKMVHQPKIVTIDCHKGFKELF